MSLHSIPDVQNLSIPNKKSESELQLDMELCTRNNNANSIELMIVKYQTVCFQGGVFHLYRE
jgi:hypothetical protein